MKKLFFLTQLLLLLLSLAPLTQQAQDLPALPRSEEQAPHEKIYLRSDREFYLAGEIVWYKVHLVSAVNQPLKGRQLLMVELWNKEKAVLQQQIEIEDGSAQASFYLPLYLGTAEYIIRAYTAANVAHQKAHFEKRIAVVNTFNKQAAPTAHPGSYDAQLLPEGGQMVQGLPARLGLKVIDFKGHPLEYTAHLLKLPEDTLLSFSSHKFGLASFGFTPDSTAGYRLALSTADSNFSIGLPPIAPTGVVLGISTHPDHYRAHIYRQGASAAGSGTLVVYSGGQLIQQKAFSFESDSLSLLIPRSSLAEGISRVTLFDHQQQALAERLLFEQPRQKLALSLAGSQSEYGQREKLALKLESTAGSDLSLAVFRLDSLNQPSSDNILSHLWLSSELKGRIDSASYYFGPLTPDRQRAIDNLLLTHGWRGFKPSRREPMQWPGHQIRLKVSRKAGNEPVSGETFYLSIPGKDFRFYSSTTNQSGIAHFYTDRLLGRQEILIAAAKPVANNYQYEILSEYSSKAPLSQAGELYVNPHYRHTLEKLSLNMQVQNVYMKERVNAMAEAPPRGLPFFGESDFIYPLDAYTRFPTMEEVLREYVKEVQVRKDGDDYRLRMFYDVSGRFFDNEPLRLIDGIPVYNSNKVIDFDPLQVEKLAVVDNRFILGDKFCDGVVSFTTYKGDAKPEDLNPEAFITSYQALEEKRIFYSPRYAQPDTLSKIPDFRTLLYWDPNISLDANGQAQLEFFTGDRPGKYFIRVEGINQNGVAGYRDLKFEVTGPGLP